MLIFAVQVNFSVLSQATEHLEEVNTSHIFACSCLEMEEYPLRYVGDLI